MHKFAKPPKIVFVPFLLIFSACVNCVRIETGLVPVSVFQTYFNRAPIELINKTTPKYFSNICRSNLSQKTEEKGWFAGFNFYSAFSSIEIYYNAHIIQCVNFLLHPLLPSQYLITFIHKKSIFHKCSAEDPFFNS